MEHKEGAFEGAGGIELFYQSSRAEKETRAVLAIIHGFGEHNGRLSLGCLPSVVEIGMGAEGTDAMGS
jgi:alpha-beta hydrolase superfamily lysophospholipase